MKPLEDFCYLHKNLKTGQMNLLGAIPYQKLISGMKITNNKGSTPPVRLAAIAAYIYIIYYKVQHETFRAKLLI